MQKIKDKIKIWRYNLIESIAYRTKEVIWYDIFSRIFPSMSIEDLRKILDEEEKNGHIYVSAVELWEKQERKKNER